MVSWYKDPFLAPCDRCGESLGVRDLGFRAFRVHVLKRSLQEPVVSRKKQKLQIQDIDSLEAGALNFGGRVYSKLRALGLVDKYIQAGGRTFIRYRLSKNLSDNLEL